MRVAYLLAEYPRLSETFISGEIEAHLAAGLDLTVISLFRPSDLTNSGIDPAFEQTVYLDIDRSRIRRLLGAPAGLLSLTVRRPAMALEALRFARYRDMAMRLLVLELLRRWRWEPHYFDVIHVHFGQICLLGSALKASGLSTSALVSTFHGIDVSAIVDRFGPTYYQPLFNQGDLFLLMNDRVQSILADRG